MLLHVVLGDLTRPRIRTFCRLDGSYLHCAVHPPHYGQLVYRVANSSALIAIASTTSAGWEARFAR